jgi:hypothetical protein
VSFQSVALLELCVVVADASNEWIVLFYHHPIDMDVVMFHVKFDGRLPISVLWNKQLYTKSMEFKTVEFSKVANFLNAAASHLALVPFTHIVTVCLHRSIVSVGSLHPQLHFPRVPSTHTYRHTHNQPLIISHRHSEHKRRGGWMSRHSLCIHVGTHYGSMQAKCQSVNSPYTVDLCRLSLWTYADRGSPCGRRASRAGMWWQLLKIWSFCKLIGFEPRLFCTWLLYFSKLR